MAFEERVEEAFEQLRAQYRGAETRKFLADLEGRILDDEDLREGLSHRHRPSHPYVMVSFDRRSNDKAFSYAMADRALVAFDRISGGTGITKPMHQVRALRWNAPEAALLTAMLGLAKAYKKLKFRRILIVPYPAHVTGYRLDPGIYQR